MLGWYLRATSSDLSWMFAYPCSWGRPISMLSEGTVCCRPSSAISLHFYGCDIFGVSQRWKTAHLTLFPLECGSWGEILSPPPRGFSLSKRSPSPTYMMSSSDWRDFAYTAPRRMERAASAISFARIPRPSRPFRRWRYS